MKLIIIAAGHGSRIRSLSRGLPKTLLKLNDNCLIDHLLDNCIQNGIQECVVVTGYKNDLIEDHLKNIRQELTVETVYNPDWNLPNGISVLAAKAVIPRGNEFMITMSDHLYGPQLLSKILNSNLNNTIANVGLDFDIENIFDIDDGMKVKVDASRWNIITAMSKELKSFDAIDCGVFKCRYAFFQVLEQIREKATYSLSDACNLLIKERKLGGVDIKGDFWIDIDTEEAFTYVQSRNIFK